MRKVLLLLTLVMALFAATASGTAIPASASDCGGSCDSGGLPYCSPDGTNNGVYWLNGYRWECAWGTWYYLGP